MANVTSLLTSLCTKFDELGNSNQPSSSSSLPSNTIPNPRNECKGITTRSGVVLDGPLPPMPPPFVNPDNEVGKETDVTKDQVQFNSSQSTARVQPPVVQSGLSYTPVPPMPPPYVNPDNEKAKETEVTKDKVQPESSQSTANVQPRVDHGKGKDKLKDNEKGMNEKEKDDEVRDSVFEEILIDKEEFFLPKTPPIIPNKPTKTLPYPSRVEYEKKSENDKVQIQKFWEMFKKIHVNITLADALILMPKYQKMLKSLLSNKEKLNEMANTPVSENCSAIILKKLPEKLEDPGRFLIPCTFSELKCKALADLGASINLMPLSVYTKLGLPALQSTRMTLELANCSLCVPKGIARDVLVPVGRLTFPADFVVVDFECDYRVPLILGRPFLRTARALIDVFGEEMSLRTDEERLIISVRSEELKYTTRPHKESVCMIDIFSSPKEKDEDSNAIFTSSEVVKCDFLTTNEKVEKHEVKTCNLSREISSICPSIKERLNFWKNKEVLEKNEILKRNNTCDFQTPSSSLKKKKDGGEKNLDVKTIVSFFAPIGNCVRKWATNEFVKDNDEINHEVFKSDNENDLGVHENEEEEIAFLDGLLENKNFFEMNDKKVESLERKTKEDFETKDEPKSKTELQVVHPDIEILNHFETTSYVGSDYVFYEDFNLVEMIFPMNVQGKIFDPGITFHEKPFEKDAFKDKSSKELALSKALLTLDVFDPLHPPLMDFHVTKALSGFTFSLLKLFSKKFFELGNKNATVFRILEDSWFKIVEEQSNAHNFH
ncbi:reverse transcriptase domain-containing protein [Tanacetum coccineum]|uniref:Reverse transcriptase domain-containing protein n=1 Tax=Tanacetum coccineum TaxID=301880 RepID=A0ABQ5CLB4_9ASTR